MLFKANTYFLSLYFNFKLCMNLIGLVFFKYFALDYKISDYGG